MLFGGTPSVGDHVRARRDLNDGLLGSLTGTVAVRRGRRGIVREVQRGFWSDRLVVEFDDGLLTRTVRDVRASDVAIRHLSGGERSWERRRDLQVGVRIGLFCLFALPALFGLARYFLAGGTVAELVPALLEEMAALVLWLASIVGPLGVVVAGVFVYLRYLRH